MKKTLIGISLFLALSVISAYSQTPTTSSSTPVIPPTKKHNPEFEIKKHMAHQYKRISDGLTSKSISPDQANALNAKVTLAYKKIKNFYVQNLKNHLTPAQEIEIFKMLTDSAKAIDSALGNQNSDPS